MKSLIRTGFAAVATCVALASFAQGSRTIEIADEAPLQFGSFAALPSGGSVTLTPAGTRTLAAVVPVGADSYGAARFKVSISSGNPHFNISIPASVTLTSPGGASMTVDQIVSDPSGSGFAQPPARVQTLTIGGRLTIKPSQPPGNYSGQVTVTVHL